MELRRWDASGERWVVGQQEAASPELFGADAATGLISLQTHLSHARAGLNALPRGWVSGGWAAVYS